MKLLISFIFALIFAYWILSLGGCAQAYTIDEYANAIKKAENSQKYPYGVRSISCHTNDECRQICKNSIQHALKRWQNAGMPEDFIVFMGKRYSPPSANPNWVRLVKYFLEHK